ncbi:MAG: A/G-specific adenine glycosylase, partial [Pseudomonadota bacterium]
MTDQNLIPDRILSWYAHHQRDLPWRHTRNPYFIWVSEVMLQQTQVDTVIPYYHRFLRRFPTVETLAKTSLQEVLKVWESMGYYARARHLHEAARELWENKGGEIPKTWEELIRLPGIGPYTASAILSIAFGQRVPTVDGNIKRVLSRLFSIQSLIDRTQTQKKIYDLATKLIPAKDPGGFNQGMMELGALICTSKRPSCIICPLQQFCLAFRRGLQEKLPFTKKRRPIPHKQMTAAIIRDKRGRLLMVQRQNKGLLAGLWKFPGGMRAEEEDLEGALRRTTREELNIRIRVQGTVTSVRHAYTHFRITLHAFNSSILSGRPKALTCSQWRWVTQARLSELPFSRADQ